MHPNNCVVAVPDDVLPAPSIALTVIVIGPPLTLLEFHTNGPSGPVYVLVPLLMVTVPSNGIFVATW